MIETMRGMSAVRVSLRFPSRMRMDEESARAL